MPSKATWLCSLYSHIHYGLVRRYFKMHFWMQNAQHEAVFEPCMCWSQPCFSNVISVTGAARMWVKNSLQDVSTSLWWSITSFNRSHFYIHSQSWNIWSASLCLLLWQYVMLLSPQYRKQGFLHIPLAKKNLGGRWTIMKLTLSWLADIALYLHGRMHTGIQQSRSVVFSVY